MTRREAIRVCTYFNKKYSIDWCIPRHRGGTEVVHIPSPDASVILELTHMTHHAFRDADSFIRDTIKEGTL